MKIIKSCFVPSFTSISLKMYLLNSKFSVPIFSWNFLNFSTVSIFNGASHVVFFPNISVTINFASFSIGEIIPIGSNIAEMYRIASLLVGLLLVICFGTLIDIMSVFGFHLYPRIFWFSDLARSFSGINFIPSTSFVTNSRKFILILSNISLDSLYFSIISCTVSK